MIIVAVILWSCVLLLIYAVAKIDKSSLPEVWLKKVSTSSLLSYQEEKPYDL